MKVFFLFCYSLVPSKPPIHTEFLDFIESSRNIILFSSQSIFQALVNHAENDEDIIILVRGDTMYVVVVVCEKLSL